MNPNINIVSLNENLNKIKKLDEQIYNFSNPKEININLNIPENKIEKLYSNIKKLNNEEIIDIFSNKIGKIYTKEHKFSSIDKNTIQNHIDNLKQKEKILCT